MVVADRFTIVQKLTEGGHGELFLTCDSNHHLYVLKAEEADKPRCSVQNEISIYASLGQSFIESPVLGIPRIFYHGMHTHNNIEFYVLVMEYLERSLYDRMIEHGGSLSLKSVLMVGIQLLRILEDIHGRGFIHRDVKPQNILTGSSVTDSSSVYLCDFGIAKYIPLQRNGDLDATYIYGTVEFASRRALMRREQGRCDDLESLGYTLIYLLYGFLPWQGISFPSDDKQRAAVRAIYYDSLWKDLPPEMKMYTEYVKSLGVSDKPDYDYLRSLLNASLRAVDTINDGHFEWSSTACYIVRSEDEVQPHPANRNEQQRDRDSCTLRPIAKAPRKNEHPNKEQQTIQEEGIEEEEDPDMIHKVFNKKGTETVQKRSSPKAIGQNAEDKRMEQDSDSCSHAAIPQTPEHRVPAEDDVGTSALARTSRLQKLWDSWRKYCVCFTRCIKFNGTQA